MYVLLHNLQKSITKLFTLAVFSIAPLVRIHSKNEVTQIGGRDRGSNKIKVLLDWGLSWKSLWNSRIPIVRYFQWYICAFTYNP